jgi:WD40 repeat protein
VFYTHHDGRGADGAARIAGAHGDGVFDVSVWGGRLATALHDRTAAVWSVDSRKRLAPLSGHKQWLRSIDMNDRVVVTASSDETVRVYNATGDYSLITVLDWPHTRWINCVALIGDNHIVSTSADRTLCGTQRSPSTVVARIELTYAVNCNCSWNVDSN